MAKTIKQGDPDYDNMLKALNRNRTNQNVLVPFTYKGVEYLSRMQGGQELVFTERYPQVRPAIIDAMYGSNIKETDAGAKPVEVKAVEEASEPVDVEVVEEDTEEKSSKKKK